MVLRCPEPGCGKEYPDDKTSAFYSHTYTHIRARKIRADYGVRETPRVTEAPSVPAEKAVFKVEETKVKLEKIPELESSASQASVSQAPTAPSGQAPQPAQPGIPEVKASALKPTLDALGSRWNMFLEAPAIDEKERFRWTKEDSDNIVAALEGLDAKYHFMQNWLSYAPEIFVFVVLAGTIAKLVFGARWKDKSRGVQPAGPTVPEQQKPSVVERIQAAITPKPNILGTGMPADLAKDATAYMQQNQAAPPAQ